MAGSARVGGAPGVRVGSVVAVVCAPDLADGHGWLVPPAPRPIVGRVVRALGQDRYTIRPVLAASGIEFGHSDADIGKVGAPDVNIRLQDHKCVGDVTRATGGGDLGAWGFYTGADPSGGRIIDRIVARDLSDSGLGRMQTMYRVRQVGVGAQFDVFCTEDDMRRYWPDGAERALEAFEARNPRPLPA